MSSTACRLLPVACCLLLAARCDALADAAVPWHQDFEGPSPSWQAAGGNVRGSIAGQKRVGDNAYAGSRAEWLRVVGQGGTNFFVGHAVGRPQVISELKGSIWVKADRPGIQILARVVLPRTQDPRSHNQAPIMLRLDGTSYTQVGRWQQLRLERLDQELVRRIRGLRLQMGPHVDGREAYVDQILLNVYGGPGTTNVWIDELDVTGYVEATPGTGGSNVVPIGSLPDARSATPGPAGSSTAPRDAPVAPKYGAGGSGPPARTVPNARGDGRPARHSRAEWVGFELRVDDRPMLLRAVTHQGESLELLKKLGFNTVWLAQPASPAMLSEAARLDLMLVCPPPENVLALPSSDPTAPAPSIGPEYHPVLAWDLGSRLAEEQVDAARALATRVRAADGHCRRPLVCRPETRLWDYSGFVDVLVVGQSPLSTSLELFDYGRWIRHRARLARLDTALWSTVQTQPSESLHRQWAAGGRQASPPPETTVEQIRLMAYTAIAAGSRGLLFESATPLSATDAATRARAAAIELVNLELELAKPWVAAGKLVGTIRGKQRGKATETTAAVFEYNYTRLLVPLWSGPGAQYVPGQAASRELTFIVPTVPETNRAYEITPRGLLPIKRRTDLGGVKVTLGEFSLCSMVLFAENREIVDSMRQGAAAIAPRAARLYRQLAARKLDLAEDVARRMARHGAAQWVGGDKLIAARKHMQSCDGANARRDYGTTCLEAERAMRAIRLVERVNWETAVEPLRSPVTSPATVCFATLPWHWSLAEQTRSWRLGPNLIGGGDFESVAASSEAGWRHFQHATRSVKAEGEVAAKAKHSGKAGLRLIASPEDPDEPPALVETPSIWVESPPVYLEAGSLVRIHGWVHIPTPITGSIDGLMIYDSMSRETLAERIGETTDWQAFTLYRFVPESGPMSVTFALCGLGEVWIDDVVVQVLRPAGAPLGSRPAAPARRF